MITMHCTYPDGSTSEARYGLTMALALALYDPFDEYHGARAWLLTPLANRLDDVA